MDTRGLVDKYQVQRKDGRPLKGGGAIVLEVGDPKTWPAIAKLADSVEAAGNSDFASELRAKLDSMGALRSLDRYSDNQLHLLRGWVQLCASTLEPEQDAVLERIKTLQAQVRAGSLSVDQLDQRLTEAAVCRIKELRGLGMDSAAAEEAAVTGALLSQRLIIAGLS
jgi:hypothetical protein